MAKYYNMTEGTFVDINHKEYSSRIFVEEINTKMGDKIKYDTKSSNRKMHVNHFYLQDQMEKQARCNKLRSRLEAKKIRESQKLSK